MSNYYEEIMSLICSAYFNCLIFILNLYQTADIICITKTLSKAFNFLFTPFQRYFLLI